MEKAKILFPDEVRKGQEKIKDWIYEQAKELGFLENKLEPLPDGVSNIEGYGSPDKSRGKIL